MTTLASRRSVIRRRAFLLDHRGLALALVFASLAIRMVIPAGMMPGGGATLVICPGHIAAAPIAAMPGMTMPHAVRDGRVAHPAAPEVPCAFTTLFSAALDALDAPGFAQLPLPFAVVPAAILVVAVVRAVRLWPPRTGPPIAAAA